MNGWRKLPHINSEIQRLYDYPQQFAEDIYGRIESEFKRHDSTTGHLYLSTAPTIPEVPARYLVSSGRNDRAQLLAGRREGHYLVSYETPAGWIALKKELLAEVLGKGRDARIAELPPEAAEVLRLMCTDLIR